MYSVKKKHSSSAECEVQVNNNKRIFQVFLVPSHHSLPLLRYDLVILLVRQEDFYDHKARDEGTFLPASLDRPVKVKRCFNWEHNILLLESQYNAQTERMIFIVLISLA